MRTEQADNIQAAFREAVDQGDYEIVIRRLVGRVFVFFERLTVVVPPRETPVAEDLDKLRAVFAKLDPSDYEIQIRRKQGGASVNTHRLLVSVPATSSKESK